MIYSRLGLRFIEGASSTMLFVRGAARKQNQPLTSCCDARLLSLLGSEAPSGLAPSCPHTFEFKATLWYILNSFPQFVAAPSGGVLKLNSDAANFSDGSMGFGFVLRNHDDTVLVAGSKSILVPRNNTLIEALALRYALRTVTDHGHHDLCLESDSQILISTLQTQQEADPQTMLVLDDIRGLPTILTPRSSILLGGRGTRLLMCLPTSLHRSILKKYGLGRFQSVVRIKLSKM
ncbi:hypothetical protein ACS0TY_012181 [Phlomoides rotata]